MTTATGRASTYRLQFGPRFTFADARDVVPYLDRLGITDCYASPLLKSTSGSEHGYDICDHSSLNPALGSERDLDGLACALHGRGMGLVLDFVPNHMGLDPAANRWWRDVLEHGPSSPYADYFDIEWEPVTPELRNRVLLPILEDSYGEVLHRGELQLCFSDGAFALRYGDRLLPVEPRSSAEALLDAPGQPAHASEAADWRAYEAILAELASLPPPSSRAPDDRRARQQVGRKAKRRLAGLAARSASVWRHIDKALVRLNGTPGVAETFDGLHDLLECQPYRLAHWKTAFDEINYRRFFDINELGAIRMEDPCVFAAAHRKVLELIGSRKVSGLRLDHPDGLLDPTGYLYRLQAAIADVLQAPDRAAAGDPFYLVVEKILAAAESMPPEWPVSGTTGYGFLNVVNGLFVNRDRKDIFVKVYERLSGRRETFHEVAREGKRLMMGSSMASELAVLARALKTIAGRDRRTRDFTLNALREALVEIETFLPVYRTYVRETGFSAADRETIDFTIDRARRSNPVMAPGLFLFIRNVLLAEDGPDDEVVARRRFAMRFQQFSAAVQAKGVEDTGFYRYNALLSLNEVGGDPSRFGSTAEEFHAANAARLERWPLELLGSATHDSKRGEDARARLNVLSEIPRAWLRAVMEWRAINSSFRTVVDCEAAPDPNDEYFFYQTLIGSWPAEAIGEDTSTEAPIDAPTEFVERVHRYMQKAIKESKTHTSWVNRNTDYEDAVARFVESTLRGSGARAFLGAFSPVMRRVAAAGMINSLSQLVLKMAAPGVADFYQGTEIWQLDMADPDNRRPVDFGARMTQLDALWPWVLRAEKLRTRRGCDEDLNAYVRSLLDGWSDGRIKMFVTACGARLRKRQAALFTAGDYIPLATTGPKNRQVVSFARSLGHAWCVAAVPRFLLSSSTTGRASAAMMDWADTGVILPPQMRCARLVNSFTGEQLRPVIAEGGPFLSAADLFRVCPATLLVGDVSTRHERPDPDAEADDFTREGPRTAHPVH